MGKVPSLTPVMPGWARRPFCCGTKSAGEKHEFYLALRGRKVGLRRLSFPSNFNIVPAQTPPQLSCRCGAWLGPVNAGGSCSQLASPDNVSRTALFATIPRKQLESRFLLGKTNNAKDRQSRSCSTKGSGVPTMHMPAS